MQPKKKFANVEDPLDPLGSGNTSASTKKVTKSNAFERAMREQERDLLSDMDKPSNSNPAESTSIRFPFGASTGGSNKNELNEQTQAKDTSLFGTGSQPVQKNPFSRPILNTEPTNNAPLKNPFAKVERPILNDSTQAQVMKNPFAREKEEKEKQSSISPPRRPFENVKTTDSLRSGNDEQDSLIKPKGASEKIEDYGLEPNELLAGEKGVASIKCIITPMQYPHLSSEGTLIITTFKVIFKPADKEFANRGLFKENYLQIPMGFISKFERLNDKKNFDMIYMDIYSKDGRIFKFKIAEKFFEELNLVIRWLNLLAFPDKKEHFFAFEYGRANKELEEQQRGWQIYDIEKEFQRQGLDFEPLGTEKKLITEHKYRIVDNSKGQICSTYPPKLMIPAKVTDQEFLASSRFRTKERVPSITFYYEKTKAILARSSQSKPGITQARCVEDEVLLRLLGNPNDVFDSRSSEVNLFIYDARPYLNAMANRVNGKGFEDTKWYRNCEIYFMDIDNIHHVRDGHKKLLTLCFSPDFANNKWYSQLESSNWLSIMSFIMGASSKIANTLKKGKNVLVHCSDGWDRTSQILSLAQIMLDPYFRTIEGFEVLVMKDWVYFGHQFNLRCGHGNRNEKDDQRSPVFLQFIDCVHQLLHQYPFAFEFNERFLFDLAFHINSCQFGTFLCNSYQEMKLLKMEERTVCVWSFLNSQKEKYFNTYYKTPEEDNPIILNPSHHLKHLRLWEEYFLYYSWLSKPNYNLSDKIIFHSDFYEYVLLKERKKVKELKNEVEELKARLEKYEGKAISDKKNSIESSQKRSEQEKEDFTEEQFNQEELEEAREQIVHVLNENTETIENGHVENMDLDLPSKEEDSYEKIKTTEEPEQEEKQTDTGLI